MRLKSYNVTMLHDMAMINATQAEKLYGTPRMTIRRWINAGRLAADESGYFEPADLEACLATKRSHATKTDKAEAMASAPEAPPRAAKKPPRRQAPGGTGDDPDIVDLASVRPRAPAKGGLGTIAGAPAGHEAARAGADQIAIGKQIENKLKYTKGQIEELKLMMMLKQVLDYNAVASAFSLFASALDEQFGAFDEREGAALHALAQKTPVQEWSAELRDRIEKARSSMITLIKKELANLKKD